MLPSYVIFTWLKAAVLIRKIDAATIQNHYSMLEDDLYTHKYGMHYHNIVKCHMLTCRGNKKVIQRYTN